MIRGIRMTIRDKVAFREENGILRQVGKPMDILRTFAQDVKFLHIVDLNAKGGNTTNFDLYDHMTYRLNIEVEIAPREELVKRLLSVKARAVLDLPCALDLDKFKESWRLLVGKTNGAEKDKRVADYYVETDDAGLVKKLAKEGKRVFVFSNKMEEKDAEKAGAYALIRDC